jgi:hypothetical protein
MDVSGAQGSDRGTVQMHHQDDPCRIRSLALVLACLFSETCFLLIKSPLSLPKLGQAIALLHDFSCLVSQENLGLTFLHSPTFTSTPPRILCVSILPHGPRNCAFFVVARSYTEGIQCLLPCFSIQRSIPCPERAPGFHLWGESRAISIYCANAIHVNVCVASSLQQTHL